MKIKDVFSKKNVGSMVCIFSCFVLAAVSVISGNNKILLDVNETAMPNKTEQVSVSLVETEKLQGQLLGEKTEEALADSPETSYALYIDGKMTAVAKTKDEILSVLDRIKNDALSQYKFKNISAEFAQNIEIKEGVYDKEPITSQELSDILSAPTEKELVYTIKDGDAPYSICSEYDITLDEFAELNGDNFDDYMYTGKNVIVKKAEMPLTVIVTVEKRYTKSIAFETETTYDENDYADNKTVTQKGKNGKALCVDQISYIDGKETSVKNISQTVIAEPVTEKVTVGTIEHHYGHATGTFIWPLPNYTIITSPFGARWGTNHNGMDISGSGVYGADIVASDGGTVTLAQYDNSGYGMHIIIDHGNGFQTQYAHCSELYVSAGEQVYAGQTIAAVGSTGDSTGPHLHFEIIVNGVKTDPQQYL